MFTKFWRHTCSLSTLISRDVAGQVPHRGKHQLRFNQYSTFRQACDCGKVLKMPMFRYKKLSEHALPPQRGSKFAAGFDLCRFLRLFIIDARSAHDYTIPPKEKALCATDLQISLPEGCYGRIAPRSGLTHKHFIDVGAGVIDYDYRGPLGVILFNFGNEEFKVKRGDRIAQIICEKIHYPEIEEAESLEDTDRGTGGFGSTGIKCFSSTASDGFSDTI